MSEASVRAKSFFTDLVDAVTYSQAWMQSTEEQRAYRERAEKQLGQLEELASRISADFDGLQLDREYSEALSRVIGEFADAAIKQQTEKLNSKVGEWLKESTAASESERLKAVRGLESYLATTPLPVIDEEVVLELSNSSYTTTVEYKCSGKIEYVFLLNTANSPLFRGEFTPSALHKGVKIPVRLGKAWLRKEAVPDFEKLDAYVLSSARASKNHLVAKFVNPDIGSTVGIVFSRSGMDSFVTAEYTDGKGTVDVTGEPALSKHLDLESLKSTMNQLLDAILQLRKEKLRLDRLEVQGKDVLASLDCLGFMQQATAVIVQSNEAIEDMRRHDPKLARDRLKLLGPNGAAIFDALDFPVRTPKPRPVPR
ncbi:MAG: hypothetical protein ABSA72_05640 [Nitrososphaerales archaeon]